MSESLIVFRATRRIEQALLRLVQFIKQLRPFHGLVAGPRAADPTARAIRGMADRGRILFRGSDAQELIVAGLGGIDAKPFTIRIERVAHEIHAVLRGDRYPLGVAGSVPGEHLS